MYCLLKAFGTTKPTANRFGYVENVFHRHYRTKPEKSNLIKVAVVGSGSLGDPACLMVKTADNFMYVIEFTNRLISNVLSIH